MFDLDINPNLALMCGAVASIGSVYWIFPKVLKVAKLKELVDNPNARKLQKAPVPVLGGIAVYFGLLLGTLIFAALCPSKGVLGGNVCVFLATCVMLYVGSLDDVVGLTPRSRIGIEVVAILGLIFGSGMCVDSLHGLWGIYDFSWWVAVPLTVFAGVGVINAYNMIDGVNGLSSGLCIMSSAVLSVMFWKRGDYPDCALALSFCFSLIPFLLHNVFGKTSKMFIGDAGTMTMGMLVTWFIIRVLSSNNVMVALPKDSNLDMGLVAMMVAIASVPLADTLRVMFTRVKNGRSPFSPDKSHLHHKFIATGVSHSITALSEILINLSVILVWYVSYKLGASVELQLYLVVAAAAVLVWGTYYFLRYHEKNNTPYLQKLREMNKATHFGHTHWWLAFQRWLDRGAYEDYLQVLKEKNPDAEVVLDEQTSCAVDLVNFLQGRAGASISLITQSCGAKESVLFECIEALEKEGVIAVSERSEDGKPKELKLMKLRPRC